MEKLSKYDFNVYTDPKDMKGYEAFIGPNGEFYRVKEITRDFTGITHYGWAEEFLERYEGIDECIKELNLKTRLNFLTHVLGYVKYTHLDYLWEPYIDVPDPNVYGKYITFEQIHTLFEVMTINNEKPLENAIFFKAIEEDGCISDSKFSLDDCYTLRKQSKD